MISVKDVRKNFKGLWALNGVSIELALGRSYAFIGPNGSGKTTLIKSILGLVLPTAGQIRVNGADIRDQWSYRDQIGYMPQIGRYPDNMRIGQLIDMMKNIRNRADGLDEDMINAFALQRLYGKPMHTLSGGTRQKVSAALAFLFDPSILILDEPTAGLDPVAVELLKEKVRTERQKGKLILITSHIMSDLDELTEHIIYINEGRVAYDDSIDQLKQLTGQERLGKAMSQFMTMRSAQAH